jgi:hypothetical protein
VAVLEYRVESSDKYHIYKVKFEGEGENLSARCSCPAGRKAALFCKHIAALLNGYEKLIIEPSDKLEDLKSISVNSPLLEKAKTYIPYANRKPAPLSDDIKSIKDIDSFIEPFFKDTKYWKEYKTNDDGAEYLSVYKQDYLKNGKPRKHPTVVSYIEYEPYYYSYIDEKGELHQEKVKSSKKQMPYTTEHKSFGYLGSAGRAFLKSLKENLNINIPDQLFEK